MLVDRSRARHSDAMLVVLDKVGGRMLSMLRSFSLAGSRDQRSGLSLLGFAALGPGLYTWFATSVLIPLGDDDYLFVSENFGTFASFTLLAALLVFGTHGIVRNVASRTGVVSPSFFSVADVAWARPLYCFFAGSLLPFGNFLPWLADVMPVLSYVVLDLRWWWISLVAFWLLVGIDRRLNGVMRTLISRVVAGSSVSVRRYALGASIGTIAVAWVVLGTPHLRFGSAVHGDEPRYLLYCESLYQGLGFEISGLQPAIEVINNKHRIWRNFRLLTTKLPDELRQLATDAATWLAEPSRRFNRAREVPTNILIGKDGGVYMKHQPGLSFLMLPAYVIDRQVGGVTVGYEFPLRIWAVNAFFLVAYVALVLLILSFLRRLGYTRPVAFVATLAVTLTLPVAAFPFQFYPEVIAGILVCLVAGYVCRPWKSAASSFLIGALAGYLPWLHVRFMGVALVLAVTAGITLRRDARRLCGFAFGFAMVLACLSLYVYGITGSVVPTALWYADDAGAVLTLTGAIRGSWAYLLDRDWGVLAYAPVFLLALPGFASCQRRAAWLCVLLPAALIVPAAGHTLHAAGTTPGRLITAVVPLAAVPLAEMLARYGSRRPMQVGFGLLFMLSLHNAFAYNFYHQKHHGLLVDRSFSGWKMNLLFPEGSMFPWDVSVTNGLLLTAWVVVLILSATVPAIMSGFRPGRPGISFLGSVGRVGRQLRVGVVGAGAGSLVGATMFVLLGTAVSGVTNSWSHHRFRASPQTAALKAAAVLKEIEHCAVCLSTRQGEIGTSKVYEMLDDLGVPPRRLCGAAVIRLQASNGQFVSARHRRILADSEEAGSSERLKIVDPNGGCIESGDVVFLQTATGFYLRPSGEERWRINANGNRTGPWERFIISARGGGVVRRRDTISLQTPTGNYVAAELGGGAPLYANRTQAGPWEYFALTALD